MAIVLFKNQSLTFCALLSTSLFFNMALITPMIDNDREWRGFLRSIKVFVYEI